MKKEVLVLSMLVGWIASEIVYTGTYQGYSSNGGIIIYDLASEGTLSRRETILSNSPSYLALHPTRKYLYAVNELNSGAFEAFSVNSSTNSLTSLGKVSSMGSYPAHLSVHPSGNFLLGTNYGSGNFLVYKINSDGSLVATPTANTNPGLGAASHAHQIFTAPNGDIVGVDLGSEMVFLWSLDQNSGALTLKKTILFTKGAGPRHAVFGNNVLYVLGETGNKVYAFRVEGNGDYTNIGNYTTLPQGTTATVASAEIRIHPNGKFLYVTNRNGPQNIAIFNISSSTGLLTPAGFQSVQGETPRGMNISPSGKFLLVGNQGSNNIVVFQISDNGQLSSGYEFPSSTPVDFSFYSLPPPTSSSSFSDSSSSSFSSSSSSSSDTNDSSSSNSILPSSVITNNQIQGNQSNSLMISVYLISCLLSFFVL